MTTSAVCPYCPGPQYTWGMGPDAWEQMKRDHEAGHPGVQAMSAPVTQAISILVEQGRITTHDIVLLLQLEAAARKCPRPATRPWRPWEVDLFAALDALTARMRPVKEATDA